MTLTLPRADVPIDSAGNVASRDLYRWMSDITARVGGATGSISDASESFDDAGIAELQADFSRYREDMNQAPASELLLIGETLTEQITSQASLIAELTKRLDGIEQGTFQ